MRRCVIIRIFIDESDARMRYLKAILAEKYSHIETYSGQGGEPICLVVTPGKKPDALVELVKKLPPGSVLAAGQQSDAVLNAAIKRNIEYVNYAADEAFAIRNAIPTAEGALEIIMANTDSTVCGLDIAIVGFGKIGRVLAPMLNALNANVHVLARNPRDRGWATGYDTHALDAMQSAFKTCQVVINTVPSQIIGIRELEALPQGALLVELASHPYGFDAEQAESLGLKAILAPGLPSKCAPLSAAEFMAEVIDRLVITQYKLHTQAV